MHLPPTGSRPRVLHVTQPVDGGVARVVTDLTRAQLAAGLGVAVACPDGNLADRLRALGADVLHWPATRSPGPALVPEVRRLARVTGAVCPDLVHAHSAKAGLAARLAVRGRIPTVFQPHAWSFEAVGGPAGALALHWERWGARWAARTVCVSEAERWRGVRAGIRGRWSVIPNGIDTSRFPAGGTPEDPTDADGVRLRHGIGPHAPLVVCVGRLCRQKGQDVLLAAWRSVLARVPDARLVLVGDGPDRGPLTARASAYGFLDGARASVVFAGGVDDVAAWYRAADLVVLPSRWEGMALAPLEAMACGRPVVVTDVDGAREGLPPALEPHCLVPPEEPATLAGAVAALLLDAPLRASLGRRGHAHVRSAHDVRHTAAAVAAVYGALLAGARTTGTRVADGCGAAGADLPLSHDGATAPDPCFPHDGAAAPEPFLPHHDPAAADAPLRRGGPSDAPRLLPDDWPAAMGRPAVVPIEYRESTHP
ncbi:glycosyltransferase [Streptomyces sp. NPDC005047]